MEHIHLIPTHRPNRPQYILHLVVIPRRVQQHPPVPEYRSIPHEDARRDPDRVAPHELGKSLEPPHGAPRRLRLDHGGGGGGPAGWDGEGVGLVDAVVERRAEVSDGEVKGLERRSEDGVDAGGVDVMVFFRKDLTAVAVDGGGQVLVFGGGNGEERGDEDRVRLRPGEGAGFGPDVD